MTAQKKPKETPIPVADYCQAFLARLGIETSKVEFLPERHPQFRECERHGRYPISRVDEHGTVRYMAPICPVCAAERASYRLMETAAIPRRYQDCDFSNFVVEDPAQQAVLESCQDYAEHFGDRLRKGSGLILCGNPGTGKNHLASAITRTVLSQGRSVLNVTAFEIIARIRQTWQSRGPKTDLDVIREFAGVDLLIVDEVGKTFGTDGERVHLFEVIDYRYREMKPTIVISNQTLGGIERYLGAAAFDRLCHGGHLLVFDWPSHRRGRPE